LQVLVDNYRPAVDNAAEYFQAPTERLQEVNFKYTILAIIGVITVTLDQITKFMARDLQFNGPVSVIEGFWQFRYVENRGAAWGIFSGLNDAMRVPFFVIISLIAVGIILYLFKRLNAGQKWLIVALSLVLGGAIGNFIDRIANQYVIDFIDMYYQNHHWPTYNMADIFISVGIGMLVLEIIMTKGNSALLDTSDGKK